MQISTASPTSAVALLSVAPSSSQPGSSQPRSGDGSATEGTRGQTHDHGPREGRWRGRDWSSGRTGAEDGRLRARVERLSVALARMTADTPAAQGARFTAIVVTRGANGISIAIAGERVSGVSTEASAVRPPVAGPDPVTEGSDDALAIAAAAIDGVRTGGGNDSVALAGGVVTDIQMGAGDDALAIAGDVVSGIRLDGPMAVAAVDLGAGALVATLGGPGGNDALSVAAVLINDVLAGGGDDRLALAGKIVMQVDGGDGADRIAIAAKLVAGVTGGTGDDVIAVTAQVGAEGLAQAASWLAPVAVSDTALLARAQTGYADVDGGAGNDVIAVNIGSVLSVSGGTGDDLIAASGGTLSLLYGAGDGNDTVALGAGSQVMLQLSDDAGPYALEFGEDSMTVVMAEGSITFTGVTSAGMIGIRQGAGDITLIAQAQGQVLDRAV